MRSLGRAGFWGFVVVGASTAVAVGLYYLVHAVGAEATAFLLAWVLTTTIIWALDIS